MSSNVTRLFRSRKQATEAAAELRREGFSESQIAVIGAKDGPEGATEPSEPAIAASLEKAGLTPGAAKAYAEAVLKGGTVVTVRPPFGTAAAAKRAFSQFNGTELELAADPHAAGHRPTGKSSATPFSDAWGWKVLLHDPTPLSSYFNWKVLSDRQNPSVTLKHDAAPFSRSFGWRLLSDRAAPFSSRFGWRVLSENPAPLSGHFGWRVLSDDPAPLSKRFGWRVLSDRQQPHVTLSENPAPFSDAMGMRVLSED